MTAWATFHMGLGVKLELLPFSRTGAKNAADLLSFFDDKVEELEFFAKRDEALRLITGLIFDPVHCSRLRSFAASGLGWRSSQDLSRCDDQAVAAIVAEAIASGEVKVYRVQQKPYTPPALHEPPPAPGPSYAPPAKYFELQAVFEHDGSGVPQIGLQVTGPDMEPSKVRTNAQGFVRLNGVPPGSCDVSASHEGAQLQTSVVECGWGRPEKIRGAPLESSSCSTRRPTSHRPPSAWSGRRAAR